MKNNNRGIVLKLHHAAAIHRMLELWLDGRKFFNPIDLHGTEQDMLEGKADLEAKLIKQFKGAP